MLSGHMVYSRGVLVGFRCSHSKCVAITYFFDMHLPMVEGLKKTDALWICTQHVRSAADTGPQRSLPFELGTLLCDLPKWSIMPSWFGSPTDRVLCLAHRYSFAEGTRVPSELDPGGMLGSALWLAMLPHSASEFQVPLPTSVKNELLLQVVLTVERPTPWRSSWATGSKTQHRPRLLSSS